MSNFIVKKVAVLGAGVMGAQIAAHLINARVPVVLFDLPAKEGPKNGIVLRAIDNLKKLSPAPLGLKDDAGLIRAANYEDDLALLKECDLVIEAIAERMDWKHDLYRKVADLARPSLLPVRSSTTSNGMPYLSASANTARIEKMPTRLAMKFGVSLARTTPLPSVVVRKASRRSRIAGCVASVGISSTRCM